MKKFVSVLCFCCFGFAAFAQSASIKGSVKDTLEKKNLPDAVISILSSKDSILIKYTRADAQGNFEINKLAAGQYVMLVTYPKFADFADKISVTEEKVLEMGTIPLTQKSLLLNEVIVRANMAVRIKGDTTEFTADSFKVKEGATVEDLLRQVPGMQVNSKGEITTQGKRVDKVLVDGEEFFGDDPTIATQNLKARTVDKVQVYDTKSEQDQMKGIGSAGQGSKTINIKLKASAKRGYFGNATAATNFDGLEHAKLMFNKFRGNQKISVYATRSNITTGILQGSDQRKLGIESDIEYDELNGYVSTYNSSSDFSDWNLRGLPDAYTAGALYSDKWNEERQKLNLYYLYNRLATKNRTTTISQTLLPDKTINYTNSGSTTSGLVQRHVMNGKYEWKIDSFASIKYVGVGTYSTKSSYSDSYSKSENDTRGLLNSNQRTNDQESTKKQLDNVVTYNQLFRKQGRRLVATLRLGLTEDKQDGKLISRTEFYKNNAFDSLDLIDQLKVNTGNAVSGGFKVTYNEPLNKLWNLVTEYSYNQSSSTSHRNSYNKDNNAKYTKLDTLFSNNFDLKASSNSGTVVARYIGKKISAAFGTGVSAIQLDLNNLDSLKKTKYNFFGITPQTQLSYTIKPQNTVSFTYRGNTVQPNLSQLQPLRNNDNPLNLYVGNPDLKVGFRHSLSMSYNNYKPLSGRYFYNGLSVSFSPNAITNRSSIDAFGKTVNMPVNVNGNRNWNAYGYWSNGQGEKKLIHGIDYGASGGRNINYLNGKENINNYTNFYIYYGISYNVIDKWNISISPMAQRNMSKSSLNPGVNNNYWTYGGYGNAYVMLPLKLELSSDIEANLQQKTKAFTNPVRITVWNAELKKKLFKDKSLELGIIAHDILNQNKGLTRTINTNFMSEERFDRISRYFMFRVIWNVTKMPGN